MLYYGDKYRKIKVLDFFFFFNPLTSEILNLENKLVEIQFFFFFSSSDIAKKVRKHKKIKKKLPIIFWKSCCQSWEKSFFKKLQYILLPSTLSINNKTLLMDP